MIRYLILNYNLTSRSTTEVITRPVASSIGVIMHVTRVMNMGVEPVTFVLAGKLTCQLSNAGLFLSFSLTF